MNKIWQSVSILFTLVACLVGFSLLYEHTFAKWDSQVKNKKNKLQFITLTQLLTPDTLILNNNAENITDNLLKTDTLLIEKIKKKGKVDSAFLDKPGDTTTKNNILYNPEALDNFFASLIEEKDNTLIRVAHYGDSQLEGDRITVHIRKNLQAKFGGNGLGYVPFDDVASNTSYTRTNTGTWNRYNVFNKPTKNGYYGLSGQLFRFAQGEAIPYPPAVNKDSTNKDSAKAEEKPSKKVKFGNNASLTIRLAKNIKYSSVSLMHGRSQQGFEVKCFTLAGELLQRDTLINTNSFKTTPLNIPKGLAGFKIEFLGNTSPDLYGLQIDDTTGITVDNYAIRGHSGDGLFKINNDHLTTQLLNSNTRLIIFQYGANMIPYLESEKECNYYEDNFYRLFMKYRKAAPNASILVIGNGDMGYKKGGEEKSYPFVQCLSNVQKKAALRAGCAFWSLLDAMGGENAILTWNRKGLCSLDGHLSPSGQKIMANQIFKAIMREYNNYIIKQQNS